MLVGNKLDLVKVNPRERKVSFEEGNKFAKDHKLLFCEASAYDQTNIKEAFETLLDSIFLSRYL
jgi:Ras-related protein Rab-2A